MSQKNPLVDWSTINFNVRRLFSPSSPISEATLFAGRKEQIIRLINTVAEVGRHAVLYGERGVGKTSLANSFYSRIGFPGIVTIRKQTSPDDDFSSLWLKVFADLQFEITHDLGYGKEQRQIMNAANRYTTIVKTDDVIRELRQFSQNRTLIIIFDEFDCLLDTEARLLMAHTLKAISDYGLNSTVILIGVADDISTLVDAHESVRRNLEEIRMPRMSATELNEILDSRLKQLNFKIEGDARWKIVTFSRGLPEYVHSLGRDATLAAVSERRTTIGVKDVDGAIRTMLLQSDQSSNHAYKRAVASNKPNALYRKILLACALADSDDEGKFTATSVVQPLTRLVGKQMPIGNFQLHLNAFCTEDRGSILQKVGPTRAYKYRFREPKMQPYVIMEGINAKDIDETELIVLSSPEEPMLFKELN